MKQKRAWLILLAVLGLGGLVTVFGFNRNTPAQHFTAKVERGEIIDVVEATGTINAVITVQVGSQVSGTIAKLNADFNSRVHKGDVVALIGLRPAVLRCESARCKCLTGTLDQFFS
jgi:HlyD family secretion protein